MENGDGNGDRRLEEARQLYVDMMVAASHSADPRLARALAALPREAFLPPGPWTLIVGGHKVRTPSGDPVHLYQNVLVALDEAQGINNGEPLLHAAWIGAVAPQAGEHVSHIGAGMGYYTALLAMLVLPNGKVTAFEIDPALARAAERNLRPFPDVEVLCENAATHALPRSDVIYVNAGVVSPPEAWLRALAAGGRMIFPWRPSQRIGIAMLIVREEGGFAARPLSPAYFIACRGADEAGEDWRLPDAAGAWESRSLRFTAEEVPDTSATAVLGPVWFSRREAGLPA